MQPKGDVVHGNKTVEGPAGAVGDNASGSIINTWNTFVQHADQAELSRQLALLRSRLDPSELDQAAVSGGSRTPNSQSMPRTEPGSWPGSGRPASAGWSRLKRLECHW